MDTLKNILYKIGTTVIRLEVIGCTYNRVAARGKVFHEFISVVIICLMESEKVLYNINLLYLNTVFMENNCFKVCPMARRITQKVSVCLQWIYMKFPGKSQLFRELSPGESAASTVNIYNNNLISGQNHHLAIVSHICRKIPEFDQNNFSTFNHSDSWLLFIKHPRSIQRPIGSTLVLVYLVIIETKFHISIGCPAYEDFVKMGSFKMNNGRF